MIAQRKETVTASLTPNTTPAERARINRETDALNAELTDLLRAFTARLQAIRVLDPACGSGNFLYVALRYLLNAEQAAIEYAYRAGLTGFAPGVSPEQMRGIELNEYAHELAPVTIWIGYLQWLRENNYLGGIQEPILRRMDMIQIGDALLTTNNDGKTVEREWEPADYIVGNPPFLGASRLRRELGDAYVEKLWTVFEGRLPSSTDFVTYWFEKARAMVQNGSVKRAGLISTNSIRNGASRKVLDRIKESGDIFMAWSDREWTLDGAAVRVSMVGFDNGSELGRTLNGAPTATVNPDLTGELDITKAVRLTENAGIAFVGAMKGGAFDIDAATARRMLDAPINVNGKPNSDVVKKRLNGLDITSRSREGWVIDFGTSMSQSDAMLYEMPYEYVKEHVYPVRSQNPRESRRKSWWLFSEPVPALRRAISNLSRCIVTPEISKHRVFVWMTTDTIPDKRLHIIARDDDYFFGVLQSRTHELWSLTIGSTLEDRPCYNSSRTFGTFPLPFPPGTEPENDRRITAIATAAKHLDTLRQNYLHPPGATPTELRARTLTNLYNTRPAWLVAAHAALDNAVFAAYGFAPDLAGDALLAALLTLNAERAAPTKPAIQ